MQNPKSTDFSVQVDYEKNLRYSSDQVKKKKKIHRLLVFVEKRGKLMPL